MDILRAEQDLLESLTILYTKQGQCEINQFASETLTGAAIHLRSDFYMSMKKYFADPEPAPEEICI